MDNFTANNHILFLGLSFHLTVYKLLIYFTETFEFIGYKILQE